MIYTLYQYLIRHGASSGHPPDEASAKSTVWPKITAMIVLGLCSFLFTLSPFLLKLKQKNRTYKDEHERIKAKRLEDLAISLLMSFAGGVLFCTIFIHVLPEVQEVFDVELDKLDYRSLDLMPQLLMCTGFFMVYLIEEITHFLMHACRSENESMANNNNPSRKEVFKIEEKIEVSAGCKATTFIDGVMDKIDERATNLTFEERQQLVEAIMKAIEKTSASSKTTSRKSTGDLVVDVETQSACNSHGTAHHDHSHLDLSGPSAMRSFLFALSLSIHELFEGLTIGLQDTPNEVWYMLFGVGAHKLVLAFCMGVEMVAGEINGYLFVVYGLMFALVSPAGIAGGILLSADQGIVAAVLQSLASGTLLYVLFFEIFKRESHASGFLSCLIVIFGFLIMFGLHFVDFD